MSNHAPVRLAKWLGLAYGAAIALFLFGGADAPDVLLMSFVALPWLVGPALAAAVCVKASRTSLGAWSFMGLEAAVIASTAAAWFYLIHVAPRSMNGVAMLVTIPLAQYALAALFFALASTFGWRARREFVDA